MNDEKILRKLPFIFWKSHKSAFIFLLLLFSLNAFCQITPIETAKKVAEKVMNESSFTYYPYEQVTSAFIQTIDFRKISDVPNKAVYAYSLLTVIEEKEMLIGISSGAPVKVWLNNEMVYQNSLSSISDFKTIAYGLYEFADTFRVKLHQKENSILIKSLTGDKSKINLGAIHNDGSVDRNISFSLQQLYDGSTNQNWILTGPFNDTSPEINPFSHSFPPESGFSFYYPLNGKIYTWQFQEKHILLDLEIAPHASFRGHPYTEWHYSNGATMWSILKLSEETGEHKFKDFVKNFCEFTVNDYPIFKNQYYNLNEYSGHNNRIFRMHMLDDASAPALPFIYLYQKGELDNAWFLIKKAAEYSSQDQYRLYDKTLCRPEPSKWTIWADDLFMYVPFILMYAEITDNKALIDDAIHQAKMFYKHLFDKEKGLYYHGWFSETNTHSAANWSRANGWVTWAMSELLQNIPRNTRQYKELQKIHKEHLDGLLKYQHQSGLWHQVIDKPDTYLETSGTALFAIALARGVNDGWLGKKYQSAALKAWEGVQSRIDKDGTVEGICQGTGIGETIDFYQQRETPPHDPRGLGAVITAGMEIQKIIDR